MFFLVLLAGVCIVIGAYNSDKVKNIVRNIHKAVTDKE